MKDWRVRRQHAWFGALATFMTCFSTSAAEEKPTKLELDATVGYRFGGANEVELQSEEFETVTGRLSADSAPSYGGILGYRVQSNGLIFLSYSRQETLVRFRTDVLEVGVQETRASIEYFQFGGNLQGTRGRLIPYLGFSLGAGRFASLDDGGDRWRFSGALDGGLKLRILPFLHARLLGRVPITFTGGQLFCYGGRGCAVVTNSSPIVQGEVQAGLGFDF